jgi:hypothetical protein
MAERAGCLVEFGFRPRVGFEKFRRMILGPQLCVRAVALLATERQLDLTVAHQAICHLRHVRAADSIRGIDAAVTSQTRIRVVQLRTKIARRRQVLSRVDGLSDERRHVAELQVFFVAEVHEARLRRQLNGDALMTGPARRGRRQVVVLHASTVRDRSVAARAVGLQLQMDAVGEWRRACASTQHPGQHCDATYELQLPL